MMSMAAVHAPPAVDNNIRPECANHAHHFSEHRIAPHSFRFLGSFRESEIRCVCKKEFHTIATARRREFLRADQTKLRRLLRPQVVLSAFAARQRQQCDVGMKSAREIREQSRGFVVRMRGHVEDARSDARAVDGLYRLREARSCSGSRGKLRRRRLPGQTYQHDTETNASNHSLEETIHAASGSFTFGNGHFSKRPLSHFTGPDKKCERS